MLSPSKERTLQFLNQRAQADYEDAAESARRRGRVSPPPPVPLAPENIEFPKWLHRGWAPSDKGDGHQKAKESKLVKSEAELAAALADGWTEEPPKADAKKK